MALIDVNLRPTDRQLRQFGTACFVALPLIGWWWGADRNWLIGLTAVGSLVGVASWIRPPSIVWLFIGLSMLTLPIGLVIGEIAMCLIYFGLFLPLGLVFRAMGRDALLLKKPDNQETYWLPRKQRAGAASYYRQS